MSDEKEMEGWLKRQLLSPEEQQRFERLKKAVGDVKADTTLTPEEKAALIAQLRTGEGGPTSSG